MANFTSEAIGHQKFVAQCYLQTFLIIIYSMITDADIFSALGMCEWVVLNCHVTNSVQVFHICLCTGC